MTSRAGPTNAHMIPSSRDNQQLKLYKTFIFLKLRINMNIKSPTTEMGIFSSMSVWGKHSQSFVTITVAFGNCQCYSNDNCRETWNNWRICHPPKKSLILFASYFIPNILFFTWAEKNVKYRWKLKTRNDNFGTQTRKVVSHEQQYWEKIYPIQKLAGQQFLSFSSHGTQEQCTWLTPHLHTTL